MALLSVAYTLAKTLFLASATLLVLALAGLYRFQRVLIYPSALNDARRNVDTPDKYGLPGQVISLPTPDGEQLQMYVIRNRSPAATGKTMLMLQPNAGNIGHYLPIAQWFYRTGCHVVMYLYRGYGLLTGSASEAGLKVDADTVLAWIAADAELLHHLLLYGRLLGGAVAIYIALQHLAAVRGMVLENTFLLIAKVIPHIFPWLKMVTPLCHEKWVLEEVMPRLKNMPMLFMSAQRDEIVPAAHMAELYRICRSTDKEMMRFPQSYHNDTISAPGYWEKVEEWIDRA